LILAKSRSTLEPVKPWQIILLALGVILVAFCGGVAYMGTRFVAASTLTGNEAAAYADQALPEILKNWDYKELPSRATPELQRTGQPEVLKAYFDFYSKNLGKFQSVKSARNKGTFFYNGTGGAYTVDTVQADASFFRDNGVVTLQLVKRGKKWQINAFAIKSRILEQVAKKS
jgi:hypothetical protein